MGETLPSEQMEIRRARADDETAIVTMVRMSMMFQADEQEFLRDVISQFFRAPGRQSHWLVLEREGVAGAAFFQPETMAPDVWNLRFICVMPESRSQGSGSILLNAVESAIELRGGRMLIAEVPGNAHFEASRRFYLNNGYEEEGRIRDFYHPGDDRVLFRKAFTPQA
jgi:ribosomal protein S18 acetylase RimI-like enzyme